MAQYPPDSGWIYQCDDIVVEPRAHRLERAGETVSVEPKAYAVLVVLLQQAGEVVGKNELLDAAWGHRHVTPGVLTRAVSQLRHTLGDCAGHPRYIATVHSLGYRFIGDVRRVATTVAAAEPAPEVEALEPASEPAPQAVAPAPPAKPPARPEPWITRWLAAAITLVMIVATLAVVLWHPPHDHLSTPRMTPQPALVLMPFAHSPDAHTLRPRHWPRTRRIATDYQPDRDSEATEARAAGFLTIGPDHGPAARE
ncbi:winged helix-turn-helix domain-containing protein [Dyella soli]|nr:transcriptional regulator [Dyella soli]